METSILRQAGNRVCVLLAVLTSVFLGLRADAGEEMRVHFIDVGQGDATLLEFPNAAILVDTWSPSH